MMYCIGDLKFMCTSTSSQAPDPGRTLHSPTPGRQYGKQDPGAQASLQYSSAGPRQESPLFFTRSALIQQHKQKKTEKFRNLMIS